MNDNKKKFREYQTIKNMFCNNKIMSILNTKRLSIFNKLTRIIRKIFKIKKYKQTYNYIKPIKIITILENINVDEIVQKYSEKIINYKNKKSNQLLLQ